MPGDDKDKPQPSPKRLWWKPTSWFSVFRRNQPVPDLPPPALPPLQQTVWVPDQTWDVPPRPRNLPLYESSNFVPPPTVPRANARDEEIEARFQEVLRCQTELSSSIDRLRSAITASAKREIGPGHNQGPALIEELDADDKHLLALLQDKGPRPSPADRVPIVEQAEKTLGLSERIREWLTNAAVGVAKIGAREVTKDLTAPLWAEVAQKIVDLYHAIKVWISLLPPM
jgi:hypothetical protein